jgi:hypothetical protein
LFLLSWSGFYYVVLLGLQNLNWYSSCALETRLLSAWWVAKLWSLTIIPALETGWILVCLGWESGFLLLCVFLRPDSSLLWVAKSGFLYNSCLRLDSCSWARNLIELLEKYGLRKKIITYVKGEGSNLNAMTIALNVYIKSIQGDSQKCIIWQKIWKG